jgi:hypothetical protein
LLWKWNIIRTEYMPTWKTKRGSDVQYSMLTTKLNRFFSSEHSTETTFCTLKTRMFYSKNSSHLTNNKNLVNSFNYPFRWFSKGRISPAS